MLAGGLGSLEPGVSDLGQCSADTMTGLWCPHSSSSKESLPGEPEGRLRPRRSGDQLLFPKQRDPDHIVSKDKGRPQGEGPAGVQWGPGEAWAFPAT